MEDRNGLPRFYRKKVLLDKVFGRANPDGNHWINSTGRAIKFLGTNNARFKLDFAPDPFGADGGSLPLDPLTAHNFETPFKQGCFENSISQPGVWVEFFFTTEDRVSPGNATNSVEVNSNNRDGYFYDSYAKPITAGSPVKILSTDDYRRVVTIQNASGTEVWFGRQDKLGLVDFKLQNFSVKPNEFIKWRNVQELWVRADVAANLIIAEET